MLERNTLFGRVAFNVAVFKIKSALIAFSCLLWLPAWVSAAETYQNHPKAIQFVADMVEEHGFSREELQKLFSSSEKKQSILDAIARPAEKTLNWKEYRDIFIVESRIEKGVQFWKSHQTDLDRAEQEFGVPANIIVAVIGVETRYGENKGKYRVMDALPTLAFDYPPRAKFFRKELEHFLLLTREQGQNPLSLHGSYAGAMGYGQFMPSSFRSYAVDFDGDQLKDIWDNPTDAIGSVANYLSRHGWQKGEPITVRARVDSNYNKKLVNDQLKPQHSLSVVEESGFTATDTLEASKNYSVMRMEGVNGAEFWLGLKNFYVITRYNHSALYAMAVFQLGQSIEIARQQ